MGKTHEEQQELIEQLDAARAKVSIGAKYRHYKSTDKVYEVVGFGFLEANDELCVIYKAQYGERLVFLRPLSSWLEHVLWDGKPVLRFTKL